MRIGINNSVDLHRSIFLAKDTDGFFRTSQPLSHLIDVGNGGRDSDDSDPSVEAHDATHNSFQSGASFLIVQHVDFVDKE